MKNLYITLFLAILGFSSQLNAQSLKNIHRHNLPILRIPIDLIDKIETVDVEGQKYLHVTQFNGFVNEVPVSQIDSITHTDGTALDPSQLGNLRTASVMGVVSGPTGALEMNAIVRSPYGGEETRTDPNGVFFLNDIIVYDKLGYITITKPGFHQASRSFLSLETGSNRVNVQLLPMTQSGTFSSSSGGTVTSGLLQLNFPANAITLNGQPYTGTVNVYAAALDPSSPEMFDQMPGELLGGMNDSLRLLRSFGMAAVELRDDNMNELQLAQGASASLTFNIPSALQAEAPNTIDWWSFDEALGYWKHEGEAQKQGNQYVGQASHFSWWNCDVPENFNDLHGSVNTSDGAPISDAQINVVTPTMGTGVTYTNAEGVFSGRVPKNQLLTLNIYLNCETTNDWDLVYTEDFSSATEPIIGQYEPASLDERYPITGTVVTCDGQPAQSGYVKMGPLISFSDNGAFIIQACSQGEYVIRAFNTSFADSIIVSEFDTLYITLGGVDIGNIQACFQFSSTVTDFEGNIYPTVLIGNQLWMASNLKSSYYSNGEEIPNVTVNNEWVELTSPAWSHYNNNSGFDAVYGKLYNWYTVVDSQNVCPIGWYIPNSTEFNQLVSYLGGSLVAGGKLKTLGLWNSPNTGASNQSGFTGVGGGRRSTSYGGSYNINANGYLWCLNESNIVNAIAFGIFYDCACTLIGAQPQFNGMSVRCLKD